MKRTHETESTENNVYVDDHKVYSPTEDLQKMEGANPLYRNNLDLSRKPKPIRYIGYFIIVFIVISALIVLIANLFSN